MTKTRRVSFSRKRRRGGRKTVKRRGGRRRSRVTKRRGGRRRSRVTKRRGGRRTRRRRRGGDGKCDKGFHCVPFFGQCCKPGTPGSGSYMPECNKSCSTTTTTAKKSN